MTDAVLGDIAGELFVIICQRYEKPVAVFPAGMFETGIVLRHDGGGVVSCRGYNRSFVGNQIAAEAGQQHKRCKSNPPEERCPGREKPSEVFLLMFNDLSRDTVVEAKPRLGNIPGLHPELLEHR